MHLPVYRVSLVQLADTTYTFYIYVMIYTRWLLAPLRSTLSPLPLPAPHWRPHPSSCPPLWASCTTSPLPSPWSRPPPPHFRSRRSKAQRWEDVTLTAASACSSPPTHDSYHDVLISSLSPPELDLLPKVSARPAMSSEIGLCSFYSHQPEYDGVDDQIWQG
jgi:hypothetical protein